MFTNASRRVFAAVQTAAPAALSMGVLGGVAFASDDHIPPIENPWWHERMLGTLDAKAVRRGHQVYTQVCATCHSLDRIAWRNYVGMIFDEPTAKRLAEEKEYEDGPNESGEMFERPGKLSDYMKSPYANEEEARFANGGAYPPDLSLMAKARHDGANYIFSLLTGYREAPFGVECGDGQYYNPYFAGGKIGMPSPLEDGAVEYQDGTPAPASQMAKDVAEFLVWTAEPDHNDRRRKGLKWMLFMAMVVGVSVYYKRFRWSPVKARKITYAPIRKAKTTN